VDAIIAGQTDPDEPGAEPREYALPRGVHVNMQEGERVRAGEPLMDGPSNPHDILNVLGEKALQSYLSTIDGARGFSRAIKRAAVERSPPFLFVGSRNIFHTMTAEDRALLDVFAKRVRLVVPSAAIWAFGSRARGSPEPDSDLDLCVVVPDVTR